MTDSHLERVRLELLACPVSIGHAVSALPAAPGLYAWWAAPSVLSAFPGPMNSFDSGLRLLYVGITARPLRTRIRQEHLKTTRRSTLRRALAALLMVAEQYRTMPADRGNVVLVPEDEARLTRWMNEHLFLTWSEASEPRPLEEALIVELAPPLNTERAPTSAQRAMLEATRADYRASAPGHDPGEGPSGEHRA